MRKKTYLLLLGFLILSSISVYAQCSYIASRNNADLSTLGGSSYSTGGWGSSLLLTGTITVNSNYTLSNSNIYMGDDAVIIIAANVKLTLDNVHIQSCDGINGWEGIKMPNTSNLSSLSIEVKNGSVIEHAKRAIWVTGNSGIKVIDSQINRCFYGISIDYTASGSTLVNYNTDFTCYTSYSSPQSSASNLLAPFSTSIALVGIFVDRNTNTINIGDASYGRSLFDCLSYGIVENAVSSVIQNNMFLNITQSAINNTCNSSSTKTLTVGGTSANQKNIFANCTYGIRSYGNHFYVYSNQFTDVDCGIHYGSLNNLLNYVVIQYNILFNFITHGIYVLNNGGRIISGNISYNQLNDDNNLTYANPVGIEVTGTSQKSINIRYNVIQNCWTSIRVNGFILRCFVEYNDIYFPDDTPVGNYYGIDLSNCQNSFVVGNNLKRINTNSSTRVTGIRGADLTYRVNINLNNLIDDNITSMRGIHLFNNCSGVKMKCNYFSDNNEPVFFGSNSGQAVSITNQGASNAPKQNEWYPANSTLRVIGNCNFIDWYHYDVAGTSNEYYPLTNIFQITPIQTNLTGNPCSNPYSTLIAVEDDIDPIVDEAISFDSETDEHLYNCKSGLVQAFLINQGGEEEEDSWMTEEKYDDWFDGIYDNNIGLLERAEYLIFNADVEDYEGNVNEASSIIQGITAENTAEEYKVYMLGVYLEFINQENYEQDLEILEPEMLETIQSIACENSVTGGEAVLWARNILHVTVEDGEECILERIRSGIKNTEMSNQINIFPNPASNMLWIEGIEGSCRIEIYNSMGNLVKFENNIVDNSLKLDLSDGLYYYNLVSPLNIPLKKGKLIIAN